MLRRWTASVRFRAAIAAALAAALCFSGGALWLRHKLSDDLMKSAVAAAQSKARGIGATYTTPEARQWAESGTLAKRSPDTAFSDDAFPYWSDSYAVVDPNGVVLLAQERLAYYIRESGLAFPKQPPPMGDGWTGRVQVYLRPSLNGERGHDLDGQTVTLVTYNVGAFAGGPVKATVYVLATPLDAQHAVAAVDPWLLAGLPLAMLLVAAVAWLAAGRALRPVERMRAELARITAEDMHARVPAPRAGNEIGGLAATLNDTLDRLAEAAERQRSFVADAAHELRSPLAGLRNTVEVAQKHGDGLDLDTVHATTERLQHLTEDLLLLARLERTAPAGAEPVDVAAVAQELVDERRYRVPPDERFVFAAAGPMLVDGRQEELTRMLRNILDNASRYARERVTVIVTRPQNHLIRVEVVDDGPGIDPDDRERVFERFARTDEARDRSHGGAGLGLAIARDIAIRHGGTMYVADSTEGARLIADLPG